eukprot:7714569-Alexandrium_andersonii.AAC.1
MGSTMPGKTWSNFALIKCKGSDNHLRSRTASKRPHCVEKPPPMRDSLCMNRRLHGQRGLNREEAAGAQQLREEVHAKGVEE